METIMAMKDRIEVVLISATLIAGIPAAILLSNLIAD